MTPRTRLYEFLLDALDRCNERQNYGLPKRPGDLAGMLADELLAAGSPVVSSSLDVERLAQAITKVDGTDWPPDHVREVIAEYNRLAHNADTDTGGTGR